jgi:hypothetical protein
VKRIKKRKFSNSLVARSISRLRSDPDATDGYYSDGTGVSSKAAPQNAIALATGDDTAIASTTSVLAWCVDDLQVLGHACSVPEALLTDITFSPAPTVDPVN